jgi:hypothetical protein
MHVCASCVLTVGNGPSAPAALMPWREQQQVALAPGATAAQERIHCGNDSGVPAREAHTGAGWLQSSGVQTSYADMQRVPSNGAACGMPGTCAWRPPSPAELFCQGAHARYVLCCLQGQVAHWSVGHGVFLAARSQHGMVAYHPAVVDMQKAVAAPWQPLTGSPAISCTLSLHDYGHSCNGGPAAM